MAAPASAKILYVNRTGDDGWLQVKPDKGGPLLPVCKYTRVQVLGSAAGRTSLSILDGPLKGTGASLADANARTFLGPKAPAQSLAQIEVTYGKYVPGWISVARQNQALDQQMASVTVNGVKVEATMNTNWGMAFFPIPAGAYSVLVPDAPHDAGMTRFYRSVTPSLKYDQVWFPIRFGNNSRYVHVGNVSDGCTTVLSLDKWADIYEALISHRSPDGTAVAQMVVKGVPERAK